MSIAEFLSEGGYVPGLSGGSNPYDESFHRNRYTESRERIWKQLCNDPRWKHKDDLRKEDLMCGQDTELGNWTAIPVPIGGWHDGAQAPNWVWESTPLKVEQHETEEGYLQRLICVVCGRFVCLIGVDEKDSDRGIPQAGKQYSWRYWDNEGHVYQDFTFKWTTYPGDEIYTGNMKTDSRPGEFDAKSLWMYTRGVVHSRCPEFYDVIWRWMHDIASVEELDILARQAGIDIKASTVLKEDDLDNLARTKGWTKITSIQQPDTASYCQDDKRINFYLTTGTVGTCLDHPTQYQTQLFHRGVDMKAAAILLDNPREHTGRGYKRKATSDDTVPTSSGCANCAAENPSSDFSMN